MSIDFAALFADSGGEPIEWQGRVLQRSFDTALKRGCSLEISRLRHTASPVQGLAISSPERNFQMHCGGVKARHFVFWTDTAPKRISVDVHLPVRSTALVQLWNVWRDAKYGSTMYGLNNAAIQVEPQGPSEFLLRCSDGWSEPNFNDLVVLVRVLDPSRILG